MENTVLTKLKKAREMVRNTKHVKKGHNSYSNFDYFTPEQVEAIVSETCDELNLLPVYSLVRDKHGLLVQKMSLIDLDNGQSYVFYLATTHGALKATNETQQMGGTDTYSERYLKMKVFQIKDNNLDFDAKDNRPVKDIKGQIDDIIG